MFMDLGCFMGTVIFTKETSMEFISTWNLSREISLDKLCSPSLITAKVLLFHFIYYMLMDCFNNELLCILFELEE